MSTIYTPNAAAVIPASYTLPSDGEAKPIGPINSNLESLMDSVAHLHLPERTGTDVYPLGTRALNYTVSSLWIPDDPTKWQRPTGLMQTQDTSGSTLWCSIELPDGCSLDELAVLIKPFAGHVGAPGSLPRVNLYKINATTGVSTLVATVVDSYASAGAYETRHAVGGGLMPAITIDRHTYRYDLELIPESGANSIVGTIVDVVWAFFTVSSQDPGAA